MNYLQTITIFRSAITKAFPNTEIREGLDNLPSHLLWMLDEIEKQSASDKASRWIGYVCRCMEDLKIFNNSQIRLIIKCNNDILKSYLEDIEDGNSYNLYR